MQTRTHNNIARMFAGRNISASEIRLMNNVIDNPSRYQKNMQNTYMFNAANKYHNTFDVFGLGQRSPHRKYNHDMASASMAGYMTLGSKGMYLSQLHLVADYWSDLLKKQYGVRGRDIWEAMFNYYF